MQISVTPGPHLFVGEGSYPTVEKRVRVSIGFGNLYFITLDISSSWVHNVRFELTDSMIRQFTERYIEIP